VVTTLQITLTTNVLIEEYWPSPIFTNTLASHEHDYVHCQCELVQKILLAECNTDIQYLTNAEYMINSRPVASESTLMIPNNFLCIWN
jgi:hypothetical protein